MKRYNIHLPEEWNKQLDEITKKMNTGKGWRQEIKKSDIIRIGIALTYNLKLPYSFGVSDSTIESIKKISKK